MKRLVYILLGLLLVCCIFMGVYFFIINKDGEIKLNDDGSNYPVITFSTGGNAINKTYAYIGNLEYANKNMGVIPLVDNNIEVSFSKELTDLKFKILDNSGNVLQEGELEKSIKVASEVKIGQSFLEITGTFNNEIINYVAKIYKGNNFAKEHMNMADKISRTFLKKGSVQDFSKFFPNINVDDNEFIQVDRLSGIKALQYSKAELEIVEEKPYEIFAVNQNMTSIVKERLLQDGNRFFNVREFFRLRDSGNDLFLVDYNRDIDEYYMENIDNKGIYLGATKNTNYVINNDQNIVFTKNNELYSFSSTDNRLNCILKASEDIKTRFNIDRDFIVKPISVDSDGNINFVIFGRMPFGDYEAKYGINYMYYDAQKNKIETISNVFINQPTEAISQQSIKFINIDNDGNVIFMLFDRIYKFGKDGSVNEEIDTDRKKEYITSDDGTQVAYVEDGNINIFYTGLNTSRTIQNTYGENYSIHPIDFRDAGDFAYYIKDDIKDRIDRIIIINSRNEIIKEYKSDYKITGIESNQTSIIIHRYDEGINEKIDDDYILNINGDANAIKKVIKADENYGFVLNIIINSNGKIDVRERATFNTDNKSHKTANLEVANDKYVAYKYGKAVLYTSNLVEALKEAVNVNGLVNNKNGIVIWQRELAKNNVTLKGIPFARAINSNETAEACIKSLEQYYTIEDKFDNNKTTDENIKEIFPDAVYFTGLNVSDLLYFVQNSTPVMLDIGDKEYALLLGVSNGYISFMNPLKGGIDNIDIPNLKDISKKDGYIFKSAENTN